MVKIRGENNQKTQKMFKKRKVAYFIAAFLLFAGAVASINLFTKVIENTEATTGVGTGGVGGGGGTNFNCYPYTNDNCVQFVFGTRADFIEAANNAHGSYSDTSVCTGSAFDWVVYSRFVGSNRLTNFTWGYDGTTPILPGAGPYGHVKYRDFSSILNRSAGDNINTIGDIYLEIQDQYPDLFPSTFNGINVANHCLATVLRRIQIIRNYGTPYNRNSNTTLYCGTEFDSAGIVIRNDCVLYNNIRT